jgi:DNA-binding winged helix-turn-helix (wHTH) protein
LLYSFEDFSLDTARRELRRSGTPISLQPQVFDLLEYLIRNRERVVSKDDLLAAVWDGRIVSESTLNTRINSARVAIGDSGEEQHTAKGFALSVSCGRKNKRFASSRRSSPPMSKATAD